MTAAVLEHARARLLVLEAVLRAALGLGVGLGLAGPAASWAATDEEGDAVDTSTPTAEVRTSLRTQTDEEAWSASGFRVGLGYSFDGLWGGGDVPGGTLHSALVRLGARLDADWSLLGTLRYGVVPGAPPMLRFSGTLEPTLHLTEALSVSLGLGLGGLVHPDTGARTPEPTDPLIATLTLPDASPLLGSCSGTGVIALARVAYLYEVGEVFATGPALQADVQWTGCVETLARVDPDSGEPIELRQFWRHVSAGVTWMFWWR